ncbi:VWA domain-containing protein [Lapillicoccus jejuensis]|uniref:VWA domain containing CoxE-like protein n=1 Tax=Lapillicoccus jejuensis TaxID=402171 RepID=A0A542E3T4_9MICO|nr:VWA domain-containing protein [Lapillicoccus jejuensis]TQJ09914.1 VWA domain containing CoxE-like protein [Lapillicoccus jejuensis]
MAEPDDQEARRRWRLVLGEEAGRGGLGGVSGEDARMDRALAALYDRDGGAAGPGGPGAPGRVVGAAGAAAGRRTAGLGPSAPSVATWLRDIRRYFPSTVVQVMQRDAVERVGLRALLLEPELLETLQPDVHLAATLVALGRAIPETSRQTARQVVAEVVRQVEERIADRTRAAVTGALDRSTRARRPRLRDVDWDRTIRANLRHWLPEQRTIVPERLVGHGRRARSVERDVVLAIDQSGSMATSVVYSAIFGAVIGSIRAVRTSLVLFDTEVVDLTDRLSDPVDVLFGTQLGGGTDIDRAVAYCQGLVTRPADTLFVLISDLYEGGVRDSLLARVTRMLDDGIQVVVLLALSDDGAPAFDRELAGDLAELGVPAFACTPDAFPDLLAVALSRQDVGAWAARYTAPAVEQ